MLAVAVAGGEASINHGADGAHAAVFLEAFTLPIHDFAWAGIGTGQQVADHDGGGAGGDGLGNIA